MCVRVFERDLNGWEKKENFFGRGRDGGCFFFYFFRDYVGWEG